MINTSEVININIPRDICGIDNMLGFLESIIEGKTAVYVSTPISTGNRFLNWYKEKGSLLIPESKEYEKELFLHVIQPNIEDGKKKVSDLRKHFDTLIIDPTKFDYPAWTQDDYRYFWGKILEKHVKTAVFLDGWQYSQGCSFEFLFCKHTGIPTLSENLNMIDHHSGLKAIQKAIREYHKNSLSPRYLEQIADELKNDIKTSIERSVELEVKKEPMPAPAPTDYFKDEVLDQLSLSGNIAQFISFDFDKNLTQRFSQVAGFPPNHKFTTIEKAIENLLSTSPEGTVNIRSFQPGNPKGEPLVYGLRDVHEIKLILEKKASENKITIVNETIDIHDGGVSGVLMGQVIEFSPDDTPKCVDKPGVCRLPREIGLHILETVYGFHPMLNFPPGFRVEFSLHPKKRGILKSHTILWELEKVNVAESIPEIDWPNNFSRALGDKAYGLLIADAIGLPVPFTTVITRKNIAPFSFGRKTGSPEIWLRTCPESRVPGKYPTYLGWRDPFQLIKEEDQKLKDNPGLCPIASVLAQRSVIPEYSGSLLTTHTDGSQPLIEGVRGLGDAFMLGEAPPIPLPGEVKEKVRALYETAFKFLGPIEMEWVFDGERAWVVQLHKSKAVSTGEIIFPGQPKTFIRFEIKKGLEALRRLIPEVKKQSKGIILVGDVGITSHFGDILRKAEIPSKLKRPE